MKPLTGYHVTYYISDNLVSEEGSYLNGLRHGIWKDYDFSGKLFTNSYYQHGKRIKYKEFPKSDKHDFIIKIYHL